MTATASNAPMNLRDLAAYRLYSMQHDAELMEQTASMLEGVVDILESDSTNIDKAQRAALFESIRIAAQNLAFRSEVRLDRIAAGNS